LRPARPSASGAQRLDERSGLNAYAECREGTMTDKHDQEERPLTWREMLHSVLAAAFGVQSSKQRTRDFSRGKPSHFIILGVLFTLAFVLILVAVTKLVLHFATP
jgi:hypothetical protein